MSNPDYTVVRLKIYKQNRRSPDLPILKLEVKTDKRVVELFKTYDTRFVELLLSR